MTCVAVSIKFAKTNQKFAENSEFCEKNHYSSKLFTSLLKLGAGSAGREAAGETSEVGQRGQLAARRAAGCGGSDLPAGPLAPESAELAVRARAAPRFINGGETLFPELINY